MLQEAARDIKILFNLKTIRTRSKALFERAAAGESSHFAIDREKLSEAADYVVRVTRRNYPDLNVPFHSRWRHFEGIKAYNEFLGAAQSLDRIDRLSVKINLAVISVLLDAGAGAKWSYSTREGKVLSRSEGLAAASLEGFLSNQFGSSDSIAMTLSKASSNLIASIFQVSNENPMVGIEGRSQVISSLGKHLLSSGAKSPSDFFKDLFLKSEVSAGDIFSALIELLSPIWPKRFEMDGVNLGDTWEHRALNFGGRTGRLIPFHKLTQWLGFSIIEPFEEAGIKVGEIDSFTPLPEYRNGGFLIDSGVIVCKGDLSRSYSPQDEFIIELRALTIRLIDELVPMIQERLSAPLPLAAILQGGTWNAGREIAKEKRSDGSPPFIVNSDGTVF